jgi:putative intracellular protease/amidase
MSKMSKVLIVVTSHDNLGDTGRKTGFYYDEMSVPYWAFVDAGHGVDIASIKGGTPPYDVGSYGEMGKRPAAVQRFLDDPASMSKITYTIPISHIDHADYDAIFLPGGHGTMWDFTDPVLATVIGKIWDNGAVVGAVCHGPAGLINAVRSDGLPLVHGFRVNSFTDAEERAVGLADVVPFLTENELRKHGGLFEGTANFEAYAVRDGRLVTGQNPKSAEKVAALMVEALSEA